MNKERPLYVSPLCWDLGKVMLLAHIKKDKKNPNAPTLCIKAKANLVMLLI